MEGKFLLGLVESVRGPEKVHKWRCNGCVQIGQHARFDWFARFAHTFVHFAWARGFFASPHVFHRFFDRVFRSSCVKPGSPSRMNRGSVSVKSTIAEGFPVRGPSSPTPSIALRSLSGSGSAMVI